VALTAPEATTAPPRRAAHGLPYVAALDGIRAIAVAGVLLYHAGVASFPGGFFGVDVFFVLSGFLITSLLLSERESTGAIDLVRFWIRRARRLLPAAWLVIVVSLVVTAVFLPHDAGRTRADAISSFLYVNNWHQLLGNQSYFSAFERPSLLQHLWSLAVEEQFYLLWPLAIGFGLSRMGRGWTMRVMLGLLLVSALEMALLFHPGRDPSRVYFGTDTHASGLLIGALLAFVWPLGRFRSAPRAGAAWLLDAAALAGLAGVLWAMTSKQDFDPWVYRGGMLVVGVASAVLIAAVAHPACRVALALGAAPLRWIGQRSYGIYLWHWPVMALTRPGFDLTWNRAILVPCQIAVSVGLAAVSYRWVEMPIRTGGAQRTLKAWMDNRPPRGRLAIALAAITAVLLAGVWIASLNAGERRSPVFASKRSAAAATTPSVSPASATPDTPAGRVGRAHTLAVGASVMLAAEATLGRHATVDAAVGRQAKDIIARLKRYRAAGRLPNRVVVQVGENGPIFGADVKALKRALRGVRRVVIVNVRVPRNWQTEVNDLLHETVVNWPRARMADWYSASGNPDLLYPDETHPDPAGQKAYARVVRRALDRR
jgi:peptidoglycan/LPS O-acetylase OafA/YrhL